MINKGSNVVVTNVREIKYYGVPLDKRPNITSETPLTVDGIVKINPRGKYVFAKFTYQAVTFFVALEYLREIPIES